MRRLALICVAAASIAYADDPKRAAQLFEEGVALAKAGKFDKACELFRKSRDLDPKNVGPQLRVADCLERESKLVDAWKMFGEIAQALERTNDDRAGFARDREKALDGKLATVVVTFAAPPPGAKLTINGRDVTLATEVRERVAPGKIDVVATAPEHQPFHKTESPVAGATAAITVTLAKVAQKPVPIVPVTTTVVREGPRSPGRVRTSMILFGAGGVAVVAGGVMALVAKQKYDDTVDGPECMQSPFVCTPAGSARIDDTRTFANLGMAFGIAGGVAIASGAVLYFTAPRERISVTASVRGDTAGVVVVGRF